ncbi:cyclin-dependent protein kinase regulator pho80 [Niveomyces insectorum RCEF 264]|uniref:Cyclin-dependent protein kinase regulator pho80 n=1 Tax=Niveomyces insectorum RCEF 264 TaxID=1081102 RepID=A0A167ZS25_9HYPO|nr:cyclin-dependent protein kinase regulator pho80 [Niveomyces insectorum RCEF 264]
MLTRSVNASPTISGFHYAPSHSPRQSPSFRIPAAAAAPAAVARRPSTSSPASSSPLLVSAAAVAAVAGASAAGTTTTTKKNGPSPALSSLVQPFAALSSQTETSAPPSPRPSRRYVAVDAATQYSPMEPFDYTARPHRHSHPPPPLSSSPAAAAAAPSLSKESTPRELPPTPGPIPMEPGIEQGVERSGGDNSGHHQVSGTQGPPPPPPPPSQQPQQQQQAQTDASVLSTEAPSASTSEAAFASFSNNHPPSTPGVPPPSTPVQPHEQRLQKDQQPQPSSQQPHKLSTSPHKRRSSEGPAEPDDGAGKGEKNARSTAAGVGAGAGQSPSVVHSPTSGAKRAKPEAAPPKVLPEQYELCPVEDMVVLIANMLGELIETNDALALKSGHLTRFHSRTAPGISVLDYLHRLAKHATLIPPLLLSMVYYIDRLCAMYPDFTINTLTVHRFLITAATVAAKGLSDSFWNNSTYARVGGVRVAELKMLELEFLYRLEWKIVPNPEVLAAYYRPLVERCPGYVLPPDSSPSRNSDEEASSDDMDEGGDDIACSDNDSGNHHGADNANNATNGQGGGPGAGPGHKKQSSTSLIGEDLVVSGLTGSSDRK